VQSLFSKIKNWESWPFKLLYAPITPVWVWYMIRSGAVWFFTPSNPKITFGGLQGEPKKEMYDLLPEGSYPSTFYVEPGIDEGLLLEQLEQSKISYPFVVKPNNGEQGILFRKIEDQQHLLAYHRMMPFTYIVQALVTYPMEVSIFYIRYPDQEKGKITGFLHKVPLHVVGDGKKTLGELVASHPKAAKRMDEMFHKHHEAWHAVIPEGEKYPLSIAANHNRGAQFFDLKDEIDERLVSIFDRISHSVNDFFYGRYDVMCQNVEALKQGKSYAILEFNGCGAEPNHFYDTGYSLIGAYREILTHWKALYKISKYNHHVRKISPWPFWKGRAYMKRVKVLMEEMRAIDDNI